MMRFTEPRASSCNDEAGLWRKLLEKAKKGSTPTEPYFAADIVVGSLQTSMLAKLGLPAEFLEHHREKLTESIILEGPDGRKWSVMLGLSWDSKPCLLNGWREFATDCNLAINDQILFFLWEKSHFLVQVFDSNHNIKSRGGGSSVHIARTTLPQVTDPIQSFGLKTTRPNIWCLPSANNNSGVAKNVHKENHTTQASLSGEKLGNQEPGVEEDDDRVADFSANSGEMLESFRSAPPDAEEDRYARLERSLYRNRKTAGTFIPPVGTLTIYDWSMKVDGVGETDDGKEPKRYRFIPEKIPEKRARQAPIDRSKAVFASTSRAWKRLKPLRYGGAAAIAPETAVAADPAKAREAAKAAANKEGQATARAPVPASDPVTPLPVEAPKQVFKRPFKRPQPRNPSPRQLYFSKRRPVTLQEREAALEAGQRYAVASKNKTHVMQLRVSQVYCGNLLGGTLDFATAMELPLQRDKKVILYDVTGRKWDAEWHGDHPKRTGLAGPGWTNFVLDHFLEEGDVCVFELPDPKVSNIAVTVFRVVPLIPTPLRWKDHYTVDEPVVQVAVPVVVPAMVQPEAVDVGLDQATLGQSFSFQKDSGMEGKQRRLSIDLNSGEEEMNKSNEKDIGSSEKEKRCMKEKTTEGKGEEKSVEEKRHEEQFCAVDKIVEEKICEEEEVQKKLT